ncbi:ABC transporter ATP-binding protein [soil metagenome]|jgi:ABC-type nitrate/sulfonate/bicarbonate transport system ATPase subunit
MNHRYEEDMVSETPSTTVQDRDERPAKLEVRNVVQRFDSTVALSETSLNVRAGEFISIVGPSGCGKSTLFNIVSGILKPTEGQVLLDGRDVTAQPGHVGYMLQKDLLLSWKTALENITLGATLTRRVTRADKVNAAELATKYGLGAFLNHYPHAMSGGMRQRVALMRTLTFARDVMLLDEPFGALDSQTRLEMQQWLLSVWAEQQSTILFVTHDVDEAIFLADRVVVMSARPGRIRQIFDVDLPRPRGLDLLTSPEFTALKRQTLEIIYEEGVHIYGSEGAPAQVSANAPVTAGTL